LGSDLRIAQLLSFRKLFGAKNSPEGAKTNAKWMFEWLFSCDEKSLGTFSSLIDVLDCVVTVILRKVLQVSGAYRHLPSISPCI